MSDGVVLGGAQVQVSGSISSFKHCEKAQIESNHIEVAQSKSTLCEQRETLPSALIRCYVTGDDGIVTIRGSQHIVAGQGSRVNALGGRVIAQAESDIRAGIGAHIEFLPGSNGVIQFGTDAKLWSGATVKIVDDITTFLHWAHNRGE